MDAARELLTNPVLPTAILAGNDRCALGMLDVFTRAGVSVPEELSLIGFDDNRLSDYPLIDLTMVHQDAGGIAEHAVRLAVDSTEGGDDVRDVVLEPKLVVRGSAGRPRSPSTTDGR